jgi:predicted transcriptional regulator
VQKALTSDAEVAAIVLQAVGTVPGIQAATTGAVTVKDVGTPMVESTNDAQKPVSVSVAMKNVNVNVLNSDPALKAAFLKSVQEAIAKQAEFGTKPENVKVKVSVDSAGKVVVKSVVTPPKGIVPSTIRTTLASSTKAGELTKSVVKSVKSTPGMKKATTGEITADAQEPEPVSMSMRLKGLDCDVLQNNAALKAAFEKQIKDAVAK